MDTGVFVEEIDRGVVEWLGGADIVALTASSTILASLVALMLASIVAFIFVVEIDPVGALEQPMATMVESKANSKTMGRILIGDILHGSDLSTVIPLHYGFDD